MALPLPFQSCVGLASLNIISPVVNPSMGSRIRLRSTSLVWHCYRKLGNWLGQKATLIFHPENEGSFLWQKNSKANFMKHKDG